MRNIKLLLAGLALMMGNIINAQEENQIEIKKDGDKYQATFYYDNGQIAQEGTYKDGKLHGEWIAYDQTGNKTAIGKYENGQKVGKWFFWKEDELSEVDFDENRIANVRTWKVNEALVTK